MKLIWLEQYTVHDKNLVLLVLYGFVLAENVLVFTGLCVLPATHTQSYLMLLHGLVACARPVFIMLGAKLMC